MPFQLGRNPKTFEPLVSLLVYNFNYGRYLAECFDSMLAQSYSNIEIIFSKILLKHYCCQLSRKMFCIRVGSKTPNILAASKPRRRSRTGYVITQAQQ